MAEGDSLVRIARKLGPAMIDREVETVLVPNPRSTVRNNARRIEGLRVLDVETRGKHLLIHLDEGLVIHSHLGMNGGWRVDAGRGFGKPDRNAWLILELEGEGGRPTRVGQFGGTTLRLVRSAELVRDPRLARLGPDILAPSFDAEAASGLLRGRADQVGVALLDQTLLCGIGNIFKSEACFEAGIDPWRTASSLTSGEGQELISIARRQMLAAVETGKRPGRIYKKTGRPCLRCRAARVRSRGQGDDNRTTYWCPNCQT